MRGPGLASADRAAHKGFSLIELLVAMAVVGIFLGAVLTVFVNFLSESSEQAALGKRGTDARLGLELMRGDLQRIGYGIAEGDLAPTVSGGPNQIQFLSTAVHSRGNDLAGVHGILYKDGGLTVHDRMSGTLPDDQQGVVLTPDRDKLQWVQLQNVDTDVNNLFFVTRPGSDPDYFYKRRYQLSSTDPNPRDYCADSSRNLQVQDAADTGDASFTFDDNDDFREPIVDCVLDLQFRYGYRMSDGTLTFKENPSEPAGADDSYPDVVKIGMIIQVGHKYRSQTPTSGTINYDDPDLALAGPVDPAGPGQAEHWRWQTVEWSIPLENMP